MFIYIYRFISKSNSDRNIVDVSSVIDNVASIADIKADALSLVVVVAEIIRLKVILI